MKNIFYCRELFFVGGIESFEYYIAKHYKDNPNIDIELVYKKADESQLKSLQKVAKCTQYVKGQKLKCDNFFFPSRDYGKLLDDVEAKKVIECFHMAEITDWNSNYGSNVDKFLAVSQTSANLGKKKTGKNCECFYPIIDVGTPTSKKYDDGKLHLITCSRLNSDDKGYKRMVKLLNTLDKNNIKYQWDVFGITNSKIDGRFNFRGRELDRTILANEIYKNDFLVQLSDAEGFGIAIAESLNLNVPIISTPISVLHEHLVNDNNCIVYNFDCSNGNEVINKIKTGNFEFNYKPPASDWDKLLG